MNIDALKTQTEKYKQVLANTITYREAWHSDIKPMLKSILQEIVFQLEIPKAVISEKTHIDNLEAIVLDLGKSSSGISENLDDSGIKRIMIKSNGSLIYQQLFNGKIMVMLVSPHIEGYGEPKPPLAIEILRPEEIKPPLLYRHLEAFLKDITEWEDYDDDQPARPRQSFNPIGFQRNDT